MKKICAVFALFFTLIFSIMSLYSAPAQTPKAAGKQPAQAQPAAQTQPAAQQQLQAAKPKTVIAKSYSFAEELIEIPLKPFEAQKIADEELMNMNPQLLKLYENAVNAEKQPNNFKEPASDDHGLAKTAVRALFLRKLFFLSDFLDSQCECCFEIQRTTPQKVCDFCLPRT